MIYFVIQIPQSVNSGGGFFIKTDRFYGLTFNIKCFIVWVDFVFLNFKEGSNMNLKEYIGLGLLLGLIAVFATLTVIKSDLIVLQIFATVVVLVMCLSFVVYANAFDSFLLKREFERTSTKLDELLKQAWRNNFQEVEIPYLQGQIDKFNNQISEIKDKQLANQSSLTSSIFGLIQIEGRLVCLVEIQSIIIKIKKYLDEVESIFGEKGNERVHVVLLNIRDFYKRVCDLTSNPNCFDDIRELNCYRTILSSAEAEYSFVTSTTRSIKTNGEPK